MHACTNVIFYRRVYICASCLIVTTRLFAILPRAPSSPKFLRPSPKDIPLFRCNLLSLSMTARPQPTKLMQPDSDTPARPVLCRGMNTCLRALLTMLQ